MTLNFEAIWPSLPFILAGVVVTIKFTLASLLGGLPLGILLAVAKISHKPVFRWSAETYTSIFRGTPILVQLFIVYFGLPQIIGYNFSAFEAGVIAFSLNSAAYSSEIIRAGIQAIDRGQWEAAQVLGLSHFTTLKAIILPQAVRNILPALVNEIVDLLKESALVSTIGEADLLRRSQIVAAEKYLFFEPYLIAAAGYYIMVMIITLLAKLLERKMRHA
jgi:His/Glu/Gln/Arg/opine family amino acid ABC transporter permease subunit